MAKSKQVMGLRMRNEYVYVAIEARGGTRKGEGPGKNTPQLRTYVWPATLCKLQDNSASLRDSGTVDKFAGQSRQMRDAWQLWTIWLMAQAHSVVHNVINLYYNNKQKGSMKKGDN